MDSRCAIVAGGALLAFLAIGAVVSHGPPSAFDLLAVGERARFPALALFLTRAGLFPTYFALCVLALVFGAIRRAYLPAALVFVAEIVGAWLASDAFKALFRRARPEYYYSIHETSYAYASGHATLSLACYGFLGYVVWRSPIGLGVKRFVTIALGIWVLGIGWSRLALGAHFPTDLIGGYLLALAILMLATAAVDRVSPEPTSVDRRGSVGVAAKPDAHGAA